jgi:outer membrane cobalamin receptor
MDMSKHAGIAGIAVLTVAAALTAIAEQSPVQLGDISVTATRTAKRSRDVPACVATVRADEIAALPVATVDQLLTTLPGVEIQGAGLAGSPIKLSMRGLNTGYQTKRVLVLVDGRRFNEQFQGNAELSTFPTENIDHIEVLRGPASALYGSGAMGGVVNIVTRRGTEEPHYRIGVFGGDHATLQYNLAHGARVAEVDYYLTASRYTTDGYLTNRDGSNRDWQARNVTANVGRQISPDGELRLLFGYYEGEGQDDNAVREVKKDYEMVAYTKNWLSRPDESLILRAYRNGEAINYDWVFPGTGVYDQETLGAELQQSFRLGSRNRITVGVEARQEAVDIDEVSGRIKEAEETYGVYLQDEVVLGERLQVIAGIRADYNATFGTAISPRVGVLERISEDIELFASVNLAHRAPALSDRFVRTQFNGMTFVGNPDLDPETLTAYELGARCRVARAVQAELAFFYNDMQDSFDFLFSPADGTFVNQNATRARTQGLEAGVKVDLLDVLALFANYTYIDGRYTDFEAIPGVDGNRLAYLAAHKASAGIVYRNTRGMRHGATLRYVGNRYGNAQNSENERMDGYIVSDWHSRVPIAGALAAIFRVDNVFDAEYRDFPQYPQPGRTVLGGIEAIF